MYPFLFILGGYTLTVNVYLGVFIILYSFIAKNIHRAGYYLNPVNIYDVVQDIKKWIFWLTVFITLVLLICLKHYLLIPIFAFLAYKYGKNMAEGYENE